jgi:hypothetical protein
MHRAPLRRRKICGVLTHQQLEPGRQTAPSIQGRSNDRGRARSYRQPALIVNARENVGYRVFVAAIERENQDARIGGRSPFSAAVPSPSGRDDSFVRVGATVVPALRRFHTPAGRRATVRKLRMDVEALDVESFPVAPAEPAFRGTVQAADALLATQVIYCTRGDTCRTSCGVIGDCTCPPPP